MWFQVEHIAISAGTIRVNEEPNAMVLYTYGWKYFHVHSLI